MTITFRYIIGMACFALSLFAQAQQPIAKCVQPDGKAVYQNWPCGTKPAVEKEAPARPDYAGIVGRSMKATTTNMARRAVGLQPLPPKGQ